MGPVEVNQIKQLISSRRYEDASTIINKILEKNPRSAKALHLRGYIKALTQDAKLGIADIEEAVRLNPQDKEAWVDLGLFQKQAKNYDAALIALGKALNLGVDFIALVNLADLYLDIKDYAQAIKLYEAAFQFNDKDSTALYCCGIAYYHGEKYNEAAQYFHKALSINPREPGANYFLSSIYNLANHRLRALEFYKNELALNPSNVNVLISYGNALQYLGKVKEGLQYYSQGTRAQNSANLYSFLLYIMHHDPDTRDQHLLEAATECYTKCFLPLKQNILITTRENKAKNKIRLGFVSMHFRKSSAEFAALDIFKNLNREEFEIYFYSYTNFNHHDELTEEFKTLADSWTDINDMDLQTTVSKIQNDDIDILVDLVGHVKDNRLEIFACKPAPVQVSWLHYFGTTGLPEMDWVIANDHAIPPTAEQYYTEKVYRMPSVYVPHKSKFLDIKIDLDIPIRKNGYITFGSLNRFSKINSDVLNLWSQVLQETENSRLIMCAKVLMEDLMKEHIWNIFKQHGIAQERIILEPYPEIEAFYKKFNEIDVHLDPFPYGGGTTTFDASWMGVPTICLTGERWTSRFGLIILDAIGCGELVTSNQEEYIKLAKKFSNNPDLVEHYKKTLRDKFLSSDFFNYDKLTHDLEDAFRSIYSAAGLKTGVSLNAGI